MIYRRWKQVGWWERANFAVGTSFGLLMFWYGSIFGAGVILISALWLSRDSEEGK